MGVSFWGWFLPILLCFCGCVSSPRTHGIPNFSIVEPGVYRGGQPDKEGWRYLYSLGVREDLKLNSEAEGSDDYARSLGMQVYYEPITLPQQMGWAPLDRETIFQDVWRMSGSAVASARPISLQRPIFVHCKNGWDRTGLVVGAYRVWVCGWTKDRAETEMLARGFHRELKGLEKCWEGLR